MPGRPYEGKRNSMADSLDVFISWSGQRSKALALQLHDWLKAVVQRANPWMSERDIGAGQRWNEQISARLKDTHFGIICLTPENLNAPWLLFEAGAVAKALDLARVVPSAPRHAQGRPRFSTCSVPGR